MKVLYLGEETNLSLSGPSVHIEEMCRALRQRGHEVDYLAAPPVSSYTPRFLARLSQRMKGYDVVYQRERIFDPFPTLCGWAAGKPVATEVNGMILEELQRSGARLWSPSYVRAALCQWLSLGLSSAVFASSRGRATTLTRRYRLRPENVVFIQNGVDLKKIFPRDGRAGRQELGLPEHDLIVGFLGSHSRNNTFSPFLRAFARVRSQLPHLRLVTVGPGNGKERLAQEAGALKLEDRVSLLPAVPHARTGDVLSAFDVCLLPANRDLLLENDGVLFSMKLAEYAAAGRPVLKHDLPGTETYATLHDWTWTLNPLEDQNNDAILLRLLNEEERRQKGLGARLHAEVEYAWEKSAETVERVLLRNLT